ncbi:MAG: hypothetical protein AAB586_00345 [Patescibacteria group bacterium]
MNNIINNDKMTKIISVVLAVVFGVLVVSLVTNAVTTISTSITTAGDITTSAGNIAATTGTLTVGGVSTLTGDVTMSGGNGGLTLTTANNATSTIQVGCIQMYATSTATAVRFLFHASTTISTTVTGTAAGYLLWGYGTCPF